MGHYDSCYEAEERAHEERVNAAKKKTIPKILSHLQEARAMMGGSTDGSRLVPQSKRFVQDLEIMEAVLRDAMPK